MRAAALVDVIGAGWPRAAHLPANLQDSLSLEQDRFGWNHLTSTETSRPKRESCSIPEIQSKIHAP